MSQSELERIERLRARFAASAPGVLTGIGDDAAVLVPPRGKKLVWTVDEQVEGVHFRRELCSWEDLGYRSFMAAASDLAAMSAEPWCALAALALTPDLDEDAFEALTEGQRLAADTVGASVVGGNLSRAAAVAITTTLLGLCGEPVERRGARPGDTVWVAGELGLARAGLLALERKVVDARVRPAIAAWLRPVARIQAGLAMAGRAHAAIDVSDGLARDAGLLAEASGVRIVLDADKLLQHCGATLERAAQALGADRLDLALHGGEDYAVLAASDVAIDGFEAIGAVREGEGLGLSTGFEESDLDPKGFDHFAP